LGVGQVISRRNHPSPQPSPLAGEREFLFGRLGLHRRKMLAFLASNLPTQIAKSLPDTTGV
jgi:hypothetical protein